MAQALWTGTISFGLVNVPVKLYPAVRKKDVRFHEIDRLTGQRVRHQRVRHQRVRMSDGGEPPVELSDALASFVQGRASASSPPPTSPRERGEEMPAPTVEREDLVKGFEVAPDHYVTVTQSELDSLLPQPTRTMDVEQFVHLDDADPIYFENSYYVVPIREGIRPFAVLLDAMKASGLGAITWIFLRRKRHLALLRPHRGVMVLTTLLHHDEVLPVDEVAPATDVDISPKEANMARLLVDTLSGPFELERYEDDYRKRVMELIESRSPAAISAPEPAPEPTRGVEELMAALQASLDQARQQRGEKPRRKRETA